MSAIPTFRVGSLFVALARDELSIVNLAHSELNSASLSYADARRLGQGILDLLNADESADDDPLA